MSHADCSSLPPAAVHTGKCATGIIITRHTKGLIALCTLRAVAKEIILLQGKSIFILLMIPDTLPTATTQFLYPHLWQK